MEEKTQDDFPIDVAALVKPVLNIDANEVLQRALRPAKENNLERLRNAAEFYDHFNERTLKPGAEQKLPIVSEDENPKGLKK